MRNCAILNWVRKKTEDRLADWQIRLPSGTAPHHRRDANKNLTFLINGLGAPFTAPGFGNWFRDRCNEAGLPRDCRFHGLRKAAATRLIDAGCDVVEAAAITSHANLKELQRYVETRDRKKAARRAMHKLISGTEASNPTIRFDKAAKKRDRFNGTN